VATSYPREHSRQSVLALVGPRLPEEGGPWLEEGVVGVGRGGAVAGPALEQGLDLFFGSYVAQVLDMGLVALVVDNSFGGLGREYHLRIDTIMPVKFKKVVCLAGPPKSQLWAYAERLQRDLHYEPLKVSQLISNHIKK
jgi:hypothetical protein